MVEIRDIARDWADGGESRVSAYVDGEILWFASEQLRLTDAPEAFASALLLPAMERNEPLVIDRALDPLWKSNQAAISAIAGRWWQLPAVQISDSDAAEPPVAGPPRSGRAQCFTGGVDSFYTLVSAATAPDILLYARGFDIPLSDERRFREFDRQFQETANSVGSKAVVISTNLRTHRSFSGSNWERCHGGALAALGHLLRDQVGCLTIPPSYPYHDNLPWGSHWELDSCWSSTGMLIEHADASLRRHRKLKFLCANNEAMQNLRVCWENRSAVGNCGRCEKCIRTMLGLYLYDALDGCAAFDANRHSLAGRIDEVPRIPEALLNTYTEIERDLSERGSSAVLTAVQRLRRRSGTAPPRVLTRLLARGRQALRRGAID